MIQTLPVHSNMTSQNNEKDNKFKKNLTLMQSDQPEIDFNSLQVDNKKNNICMIFLVKLFTKMHEHNGNITWCVTYRPTAIAF